MLHVRQWLVVAEQPLSKLRVCRIRRRRGDAREAAKVVDEIHETPVGDGWHRQLRDGAQRLLVIERGAQERTRFYEQALPLLDVPTLRDVRDDRLHGRSALESE